MDTLSDSLTAAKDKACCCYVWANVAQRVYGFDRATAQRLAFIRWLVETGRIHEAA